MVSEEVWGVMKSDEINALVLPLISYHKMIWESESTMEFFTEGAFTFGGDLTFKSRWQDA